MVSRMLHVWETPGSEERYAAVNRLHARALLVQAHRAASKIYLKKKTFLFFNVLCGLIFFYF